MATTRIPSVEGGIQPTLVTTTGDIIYASSASNPARLGIGSSAQVLSVSGGIPAWTTASSGALALITRQTFSGVATTTTTFDGCFTSTYKAYQIVMESIDAATNNTFLYLQWRYAGPSTQSATYYGAAFNFDHNGTTTGTTQSNVAQISVIKASGSGGSGLGTMVNLNVTGVGNLSQRPLVTSIGTSISNTGPTIMGVINDTSRTYTGFILSAASGNISGTVAVYGLATA